MIQDPVPRRQRDGQLVTTSTATTTETPCHDDAATTACPVCGRYFQPSGRARYCSVFLGWRKKHLVRAALGCGGRRSLSRVGARWAGRGAGFGVGPAASRR